MQKRIVSMLLALVLVLGILPAPAYAAGVNGESHIRVLDTAPVSAQVTAGEIYQLDLATVFSDGEGHSLTYALSGGEFGEHTKIDGGTLYFSVSQPGDYAPVITASCGAGSTASHTLSVTVTQAAEGDSGQYGYDETPAAQVTVYVTISNDGKPVLSSNDTDTVMAGLAVTVPYFDLGLYGLEDYYRYHTENGQGAYTDSVVVERPTALHLYIYLLERYYMGLDESECCKGTSGVLNYAGDTAVDYFDGTEAYTSGTLKAADFSGSATSFFMNNFWGHDLNLKYYRNHMYPLMSPGWGSTADYILLSDGDAIDIGLFSNWNFYLEGEFCSFDQDSYTGEPGSSLTVNLLRWNGDNNVLEPFGGLDVALYNSGWEKVQEVAGGKTNTGAALTLTLPETPGTYYLLGTDVDAATENAVNAPAVARIEVTGGEPAVEGYLSALRFTSSSAGSLEYRLSPAFSEDNLAYTMEVPDRVSGAYAWATLSENAPEGSSITARWAGTNGEDRSISITSGKTSGQWMAYFLNAGTGVNSLTLEVGVEGDLQTYGVQVVRVEPTLTALSLEEVPFNESFSAATFSYTATTTRDAVTVLATPRDESYTVTYNGGESGVIALEEGENQIQVKVANPGGFETVYEITVTRVPEISVTFSVTPGDAVVYLQDSLGQRIWPEAGVYTLMSGTSYSYTVTRSGYIGQKSSFQLTQSGAIEIALEAAPANEDIDPTIYAQWGSFRGENNLGITDARTPYAPGDAELLWAAKWGTGWAAAPNPPILVDGDLIVIVGSTIKRVDRNTGEVKAEGTMAGTCGFGIIPPTYGDGMIFVPLSGKVQAFNAKTLESLWVYTDALGGQPNCPITYEAGFVYVGFWGSETKNANFVCLSVTDEDPTATDESKLASWTYTRAGGFYWAGAYATDQYVLVGTDDGQSGYSSETASLLVFNRLTGELLDSHEGIRGDIRSNVSYDPDSDRVFFTSKGGVLCNAKLDWSTGKIMDFNLVELQDSKGNHYAMSTCTPSVYNGRIYLGVAGTSQFGDFSGHGIAVFDLNEDGSMEQAYVYDIKGYPQTSAMVTTAYADEQEGYVYIYLPYNTQPGGVSVLKDKKGQTEPITTTDEGYSEVFTPVSPLNQYCICSTIADEYGTIYYKNDSCYTMAITSKIESVSVAREALSYSKNEDGTWTAQGLKVVANLKNGLQRDVTDYIRIAAEDGKLVASYTYGFDHANYGLKTLTVELCTLCTAAGHDFAETVVEPTCVADGYTQHTCARCGYNYRDQFTGATGHRYQAVVTEPTCTAAGYTTHTCDLCGHSYVDGILEALGHDFEAVVTAPTHEKMGYTTHTCKRCQVTYVDSYTDALGHSYTRTVTKEPTCTEEGLATYTCDCGATYTEAIPRTEHLYEAQVTEPTCEEMGYTTHTCKICGHSYVSDFRNPKGHHDEAQVTEPTCVTMGYTTYTCTDCGRSYVADYVDALGHSYVLVNGKEATCTEPGYTGDEVCAVCGDVKTRGEEMEALGHSFGPWTVTREADCFTDGLREHTCALCGHTEEETIPANSDGCPSGSFTDLKPGAWYHEAVDFVLDEGYMAGMGGGRFAPDGTLTRGQLVTILYRMAGSPQVTGELPFTDVAEGRYYEKAILWATENGIASGMGGGRFAPEAPVTREQMVTFLARYAGTLGLDVTPTGGLEAFADGDTVSAYARDAMAWACETGILQGMTPTTLSPKTTATRAQAATILLRLSKLVNA